MCASHHIHQFLESHYKCIMGIDGDITLTKMLVRIPMISMVWYPVLAIKIPWVRFPLTNYISWCGCWLRRYEVNSMPYIELLLFLLATTMSKKKKCRWYVLSECCKYKLIPRPRINILYHVHDSLRMYLILISTLTNLCLRSCAYLI